MYVQAKTAATKYHWVPGHEGVHGNEAADRRAKAAAESKSPAVSNNVLDTTSLAHIAREITLAKYHDREAWLAKHCVPKSYYRRPKGTNKTAFRTKKTLAARFFQLRLQKAPTAPYLHKTGRRVDDKCWFCPKRPTQTRDHLFKTCQRWRGEQQTLWKAVAEATREKGKKRRKTNTSVRDLLADGRCTGAVMGFLGSTQVGLWPKVAN